LLSKENYKIIEAENGEEGYNLAVREKPDLILLDITMPGKDGYEVCRLLKENEETEKIPVIFLTARTDMDDKIRGLDLGAVDYITKPFNNMEIMARVKTQLKLKNMYEENLSYQRALLESQKMSSIGVLAEGIAHNFNNLLSIVTCYAQILMTDCDEKHKKHNEMMLKTFNRMKNLIKVLLEFSERQHVKPELIDSNSFLNKIIDFFKSSFLENSKTEIEFIQGNDADFFGEQNLLFQAILNILINAKESMPEGGLITVKSDITELPADLKDKISKLQDCYLFISIKDTGKGIMEEDKEKIFLPFFTTKNTVGVGLGLSASYGIIKNHDGIIMVKSEINKGSIFNIYLPAKA
jgi:signal transduction histidine kinase